MALQPLLATQADQARHFDSLKDEAAAKLGIESLMETQKRLLTASATEYYGRLLLQQAQVVSTVFDMADMVCALEDVQGEDEAAKGTGGSSDDPEDEDTSSQLKTLAQRLQDVKDAIRCRASDKLLELRTTLQADALTDKWTTDLKLQSEGAVEMCTPERAQQWIKSWGQQDIPPQQHPYLLIRCCRLSKDLIGFDLALSKSDLFPYLVGIPSTAVFCTADAPVFCTTSHEDVCLSYPAANVWMQQLIQCMLGMASCSLKLGFLWEAGGGVWGPNQHNKRMALHASHPLVMAHAAFKSPWSCKIGSAHRVLLCLLMKSYRRWATHGLPSAPPSKQARQDGWMSS